MWGHGGIESESERERKRKRKRRLCSGGEERVRRVPGLFPVRVHGRERRKRRFGLVTRVYFGDGLGAVMDESRRGGC